MAGILEGIYDPSQDTTLCFTHKQEIVGSVSLPLSKTIKNL